MKRDPAGEIAKQQYRPCRCSCIVPLLALCQGQLSHFFWPWIAGSIETVWLECPLWRVAAWENLGIPCTTRLQLGCARLQELAEANKYSQPNFWRARGKHLNDYRYNAWSRLEQLACHSRLVLDQGTSRCCHVECIDFVTLTPQ